MFKGKRFSEIMTYLKSKNYLISCKELGNDVDPF
jgi:hypothetical protein